MDFKEIQDLLRLINRYGLTEVEIERKEFKIKVRNKKDAEANVIYAAPAAPQVAVAAAPTPVAPAPVAPAAPAPAAEAPAPAAPANDNLITFKSPMIGTFYRSASPEEPVFVEVGSEIKKGETICIIEAMKLFNEIESEYSGKIVKVLAENAQPVEYDQPLFLIEPA
ncbi:MAG: acetyl-CoA carboxylase biotin carboxyl carrier protein [Bacteroidia bacterium]